MDITHYGTTTKQAGFTSGTNLTFNHTSGGAVPYLLVFTRGYNLGVGVTAVSYAGIPMTLLLDYIPVGFPFGGNCLPLRVWVLNNPTSGSNTVSVDYTGASGNVVASTYNGVDSVQGAILAYSASTAAPNTVWSHSLGYYIGGKNWLLGFSIFVSVGSTAFVGADTTLRGVTIDDGGGSFMISDNNGDNAVNTLNWGASVSGFWTDAVLQLNSLRPTALQMIII